jgi:hypothetical protein
MNLLVPWNGGGNLQVHRCMWHCGFGCGSRAPCSIAGLHCVGVACSGRVARCCSVNKAFQSTGNDCAVVVSPRARANAP